MVTISHMAIMNQRARGPTDPARPRSAPRREVTRYECLFQSTKHPEPKPEVPRT